MVPQVQSVPLASKVWKVRQDRSAPRAPRVQLVRQVQSVRQVLRARKVWQARSAPQVLTVQLERWVQSAPQVQSVRRVRPVRKVCPEQQDRQAYRDPQVRRACLASAAIRS